MLRPLPALRPPLRPEAAFARHLPARAALGWLAAGWADFRAAPGASLAYGLFLLALSLAVLALLHAAGLLYLALPAVAGFLIVGPFLALGLYASSRARMRGQRIGLGAMALVRPAAGAQLAHAGLLLGLLVLFWLRAADLLYALFFGLAPFPGAAEALANVLTTPRGWALVGVGIVVGGLFAAFAFAISLFAIPMLLAERRDALTAMGMSFAMTVQNLRPVLAWGAIVAAGLALSAATGLLGLVVVFPVLGYGTWHAWCAIGGGEAGAMMPFVLVPLSIGLGLVGLGAFLWALERGQFDDPEGAATRILFADARGAAPSTREGDHHGQLAAEPGDRHPGGGV